MSSTEPQRWRQRLMRRSLRECLLTNAPAPATRTSSATVGLSCIDTKTIFVVGANSRISCAALVPPKSASIYRAELHPVSVREPCQRPRHRSMLPRRCRASAPPIAALFPFALSRGRRRAGFGVSFRAMRIRPLLTDSQTSSVGLTLRATFILALLRSSNDELGSRKGGNLFSTPARLGNP